MSERENKQTIAVNDCGDCEWQTMPAEIANEVATFRLDQRIALLNESISNDSIEQRKKEILVSSY